jgi:hypothetical protein
MTSPSAPCLITILKQFGWRVFIIRRRLSRLKTRIQRAERIRQPTTTLEAQQEEELSVVPERHEDLLKDCDEAIHEREEELFVDLERYDGLLNDCVAWIHERTGIPSSKLLEVATSTPEGEEWGYMYTELKKLEERRVNAVLWTALLSRDQDALMSVGLLPTSESSPSAAKSPIMAEYPVSPRKERWPREEYARDAIIRLKEKPELQSNILAFCRTIAEEQGVPEIAASLKKLLYQSDYQRLWKS